MLFIFEVSTTALPGTYAGLTTNTYNPIRRDKVAPTGVTRTQIPHAVVVARRYKFYEIRKPKRSTEKRYNSSSIRYQYAMAVINKTKETNK